MNKRLRATIAATFVTAFAISNIPAAAQTSPAQYGGSSVVTGSAPLVMELQALARQANIRMTILTGTPNPLQVSPLVASRPMENFYRLIALNGLAVHEHNGVYVVGTPQALDAIFHLDLTHSAVIPVNGIDAAALVAQLQGTVPLGTIILPMTTGGRNAIFVQGSQTAVQMVRDATHPLNVSTIDIVPLPLRHLTAQDALTILKTMTPPTPPETLVADGRTSTIDVSGPPGYIASVEGALEHIDIAQPKVEYTVTIAEVDPEQLNSNTGVILGQAQTNYEAVGTTAVGEVAPPQPGLGIFTFPFKDSAPLNLQINFLRSNGHATVLTQQRLTTGNGQPTHADYTQKIPYPITTGSYLGGTTYTQEEVGLDLTLTPSIGADGVSTNATISYSSVSGVGAGGIPIITKRDGSEKNVETQKGGTFLLTGLYDDSATYSKTGIPGLMNLPLLGGLFSNVQKQVDKEELVVLVSPTVVDGAEPPFNPANYPGVPELLHQLPGAPSPSPKP